MKYKNVWKNEGEKIEKNKQNEAENVKKDLYAYKIHATNTYTFQCGMFSYKHINNYNNILLSIKILLNQNYTEYRINSCMPLHRE